MGNTLNVFSSHNEDQVEERTKENDDDKMLIELSFIDKKTEDKMKCSNIDNPHSIDEFLSKGNYMFFNKQWNNGYECYSKAIELYNNNSNCSSNSNDIKKISIEAEYGKIRCLVKMNKRSEAIEAFGYLTALHPKNITIMLNKGLFFMNIGDNERAIAAFDYVIKINQTNPLSYYYKAIAITNKGIISLNAQEEALKCLNIAIKYEKNHLLFLLRKAILLNAMGRNSDNELIIKAIELILSEHSLHNNVYNMTVINHAKKILLSLKLSLMLNDFEKNNHDSPSIINHPIIKTLKCSNEHSMIDIIQWENKGLVCKKIYNLDRYPNRNDIIEEFNQRIKRLNYNEHFPTIFNIASGNNNHLEIIEEYCYEGTLLHYFNTKILSLGEKTILIQSLLSALSLLIINKIPFDFNETNILIAKYNQVKITLSSLTSIVNLNNITVINEELLHLFLKQLIAGNNNQMSYDESLFNIIRQEFKSNICNSNYHDNLFQTITNLQLALTALEINMI